MRKAEILVEKEPPQGVFASDYTSLAINKFSAKPQTPTQALHLASLKNVVQEIERDLSVILKTLSALGSRIEMYGLGLGVLGCLF